MKASSLVIGLNGALKSGKSTVSKYLVEEYGFVRLRFAHRLKAMLVAFGLTWEEVEDQDLKEKPHPLLDGQTPRWAMQTLGTEWGRFCISEALWVKCTLGDIERCLRESPTRGIVVDDMRFPNEAQALEKAGARTVKVVRCQGLDASDEVLQHESEQHQLDTEFTISNNSTLSDLHKKVDTLIAEIKNKCRTPSP